MRERLLESDNSQSSFVCSYPSGRRNTDRSTGICHSGIRTATTQLTMQHLSEDAFVSASPILHQKVRLFSIQRDFLGSWGEWTIIRVMIRTSSLYGRRWRLFPLTVTQNFARIKQENHVRPSQRVKAREWLSTVGVIHLLLQLCDFCCITFYGFLIHCIKGDVHGKNGAHIHRNPESSKRVTSSTPWDAFARYSCPADTGGPIQEYCGTLEQEIYATSQQWILRWPRSCGSSPCGATYHSETLEEQNEKRQRVFEYWFLLLSLDSHLSQFTSRAKILSQVLSSPFTFFHRVLASFLT